MEYFKVFLSHFDNIYSNEEEKKVEEAVKYYFGKIEIKSVLIQGFVISINEEDGVQIDDSTDTIHISTEYCLSSHHFQIGQYLQLSCEFSENEDSTPFIIVNHIKDLTSLPNRESMWNIEVIHIHKMFYQPLEKSLPNPPHLQSIDIDINNNNNNNNNNEDLNLYEVLEEKQFEVDTIDPVDNSLYERDTNDLENDSFNDIPYDDQYANYINENDNNDNHIHMEYENQNEKQKQEDDEMVDSNNITAGDDSWD
ncbi:hypothetical protein DLAC_00011 [Tieghemostelium lacteum]|uniref:Uncharacterized protein n=1 Tax=Tieghemostelium lacteum TaxID=361077 RepID=A0A152A8N7_TIELA|nr:hypothetical protein DLAC_00011 [Tieghemostelium lacteum]|eukprot:KYR02572.1 hypothetical protein DLAC_00011 [Tieghemostelium lacteum]